MSTTPFPTASVVKVLIQDVPLSHGSEEFARLLGIDAVTRNKIYKKHILETSTSTDYYTNLLQNWVGRKGNDATVDALRGILEDGEFKSASDLLENLDAVDPAKSTPADMSASSPSSINTTASTTSTMPTPRSRVSTRSTHTMLNPVLSATPTSAHMSEKTGGFRTDGNTFTAAGATQINNVQILNFNNNNHTIPTFCDNTSGTLSELSALPREFSFATTFNSNNHAGQAASSTEKSGELPASRTDLSNPSSSSEKATRPILENTPTLLKSGQKNGQNQQIQETPSLRLTDDDSPDGASEANKPLIESGSNENKSSSKEEIEMKENPGQETNTRTIRST
ncbi:uncharacterized protein LOC118435821 isoform X3 [Folsomia candida]|uniref:uncharacterized protein LOC118435821 isoform X3 n=1 Tax=Folsomia candida TaxID=158441 RepID=UPI001605230D|nr:uncharacterized protein LOC118435821 isoform X3 [Folsomia candida]